MSKVVVDRNVLNMVLDALRSDAEGDRTVRGEMADELERSTVPVTEPTVEVIKGSEGAYLTVNGVHIHTYPRIAYANRAMLRLKSALQHPSNYLNDC